MIRNVSYRRIFTSKEAHWGWAVACSFPAWLFWPVAIRFFHRATAKIKDNEHIRGAELITEEEIRAQTDGTGILFIGRIRIPESVSRRHLLIAGQTGSGKSTILIQHLAAIQNSKRRAIVNDFKGDLVERFYRPDRDLILNPLDSRGLGWTFVQRAEFHTGPHGHCWIVDTSGERRRAFLERRRPGRIQGVNGLLLSIRQTKQRAVMESRNLDHQGDRRHVPIDHVGPGRLQLHSGREFQAGGRRHRRAHVLRLVAGIRNRRHLFRE